MRPSRRDRLDAWLFLPPELEREGPALLALLDDPRARERTLPARAREVERLVLAGTPERWRDYLRSLGAQAGATLASDPAPAVRAAALRLVAMLLEQQLLAPGVPHLQLSDDAERERLEAILRAHGARIDDV
ncbi:MAG: hypothetical protein QOI71_2286 [Gaiellales bacterium]|nr:hypothetical protein [Gaiellales bacterium]